MLPEHRGCGVMEAQPEVHATISYSGEIWCTPRADIMRQSFFRALESLALWLVMENHLLPLPKCSLPLSSHSGVQGSSPMMVCGKLRLKISSASTTMVYK